MDELLEYQRKIKNMNIEELLDELVKYYYSKNRILLLKLEILSRV